MCSIEKRIFLIPVIILTITVTGFILVWIFQNNFLKTEDDQPTIRTGDGVTRHWALIIGSSPELRHVGWPLAFYNTLCDYYGFYQDSIFLHTVNGSFVYERSYISIPRDSPTSKQNILTSIDRIANLADKEDQVLVWWTGHGLPNAVDAYDDLLSATELDSALDQIQCHSLYLIFGSCYSGSLIDDLKEENRLIYTASNSTETAKGSEFKSDFMWATYAALEPFPYFGTFEESARVADLNSDGKISLLEMYSFAEAFVTRKRINQHPQRWVGSLIGNDLFHYIGNGTYLYHS